MRCCRTLAYTVLAVALTTAFGCSRPQLTLYCAQDQEFAVSILDTFKTESGLEVTPKFDTEADKSVSLYTAIVREKDRPRCDVFWNNEIVSTIRLQQKGMLVPYDTPAAKPFPAWAKAEDHTWHAFAARARVLIVNTDLVPEKERPRGLFDMKEAKWRGQVVMSRPQFGTSATQAACLFAVLGKDEATAYYRALKENGIHLAPGNKQVAEWVADGKTPTGERVAFGVTDTDDALAQIKKGKPVAMIFPDRDAAGDGKFGTLFIPNTVSIIKGGPNPEAGKRLVNYLLSAPVETKLAETEGHHIPLNPEVKAKLPPEMVTPTQVKIMDVDFVKAANLWDEVQEFLRNEFAR